MTFTYDYGTDYKSNKSKLYKDTDFNNFVIDLVVTLLIIHALQ